MRVIVAIRLSRYDEGSTGNETQEENLLEYAQRRGWTIVKVTEDLDVSGGKPICDRPGIGPWFDRMDEWDAILIYSIDRAFRDHYDFVTTWHEKFEPNGKKLIAVSEDIDMTTEAGELSMHIRVLFAQNELRKMKERRRRAAKRLMTQGFANGGMSGTVWGYKLEKSGPHFIKVPDPEVVMQILEAISDILDKDVPNRAIAERWGVDPITVTRRLRTPEIKGYITYKGEIVRDENGAPKMREPIIGEVLWDRLQAKLDERSRGQRGVPKDATPWYGVMYCRTCGEMLFLARYEYVGTTVIKENKYYRHTRRNMPCKANFNGHRLEAQIEPIFLRAFNGKYVPSVIKLPAVNNSDEISRLRQSIQDLEDGWLTNGGSVDALARMSSKLAARVAELEKEQRPAQTKIHLTDELMTDRWHSLKTDEERGAMLRKLNIRLYITPTKRKADGKVSIQVGSKYWTDVLDELRQHGALEGDPIDT